MTADDGFVTGPHRVDQPHPDLPDALARLWGRVAVAGGAVGFGPADPVEQVWAAAATVTDEVRDKRASLLTLGRVHVLVGAALLLPAWLPVRRHTGRLSWLMVDPDLQDQGWDSQLHDAILAQARALGLVKLELTIPDDARSQRFYATRGWRERGRWPGAVRVAGGERDEVWLTRDV